MDTDSAAVDGSYPYKQYRVAWGLPEALESALVPADGLLSPANGYVGWWRFDEIAGDVAVDSATGRLHGSLAGGTLPAPVAGISDGALYFEGSAAHVLVDHAAELDQSVFTLEATFTPDEVGSERFVLAHGETNDAYDLTQYSMSMRDGSLRSGYEYYDGGDEGHELVGPEAVADETCALAMSLDGEQAMSLFLDYELYTTDVFTGDVPTSVDYPLYLGARTNGGTSATNHFSGTIDDIRIMNRPLEPAELLHFPLTTWQSGGPETELCNGLDDDHDGQVDERCVCGPDSGECPELENYELSCNAHGGCEYHYAGDDSSTWRQWDVWVWIPPGDFVMGSPEDEPDRVADEGPQQHVTMVEGYLLAKHETVVQQYDACVASGSCTAADGGTSHGGYCNGDKAERWDHPINCLDWDQARAYCAWYDGRLPSEAEWEYAARGGGHPVYPWGDTAATCEFAVMEEGGDGCGEDRTWSAGSRSPAGDSRHGLVDMAGNVWEWTEDDWHDTYDGLPRDGLAWLESPRTTWRGIRGGGWGETQEHQRVAKRDREDMTNRAAGIGLRCVRDLSTDLDWVAVPGGSFEMGSDAPEAEADEQPVHTVTVPTFEMARTEVTVSQYRACVRAGVCSAPDTTEHCNWGVAGRGEHPVSCVDWDQAGEFCVWVRWPPAVRIGVGVRGPVRRRGLDLPMGRRPGQLRFRHDGRPRGWRKRLWFGSHP